MNMEVKVFPYVVRFAIAYAIALVAFAVVTTLLGVDSSTGSSVGALIAGVAVSAAKFVKDHERVPSPKERKRLTWSSLGASVLVSVVAVAVLLGTTGQLGHLSELLPVFSQLNLGLVLAVMLFVLGIYAMVLWFSYGGFAKVQHKSLLRKKGQI